MEPYAPVIMYSIILRLKLEKVKLFLAIIPKININKQNAKISPPPRMAGQNEGTSLLLISVKPVLAGFDF
jgi:hypothetical protein